MKTLIYLLGKRFKFVRTRYYKATNGRWLWGVFTFINDHVVEGERGQTDARPKWLTDEETKWLEKHLDEMFTCSKGE